MARSLRSFMISFLFSLVALSIAAMFIVPYVNALVSDVFNGTNESDSSSPQNDEGNNGIIPITDNEDENLPKDDDGTRTFSVLFIVPDISGKYADSLTIMKVDKENERFVFSPIPTKLMINVSDTSNIQSEPVTLSSMYRTHGCDYLKNALSAITGLYIDYYVCVEQNTFVNIVDTLGGVPVDLKYDIKWQADPSSDFYDIDLTAGQQELNGEHSLMYMRFMGYTNGEAGRRTVQLNFLKYMLKKYLTPENLAKSKELFQQLSKGVKTNLTLEAFVKNADLLFKFSSFSVAPTVNFPTTESIVIKDIEYYNYSSQAALATYKPYR